MVQVSPHSKLLYEGLDVEEQHDESDVAHEKEKHDEAVVEHGQQDEEKVLEKLNEDEDIDYEGIGNAST